MVRIYNGILLSRKKNEVPQLVATWTQLEILTLVEVSHKETDTHPVTSLVSGT